MKNPLHPDPKALAVAGPCLLAVLASLSWIAPAKAGVRDDKPVEMSPVVIDATKTHTLFMGADISVNLDKDVYPVHDVVGSSWVVVINGKEHVISANRAPTNLKIVPTLKLTEVAATITGFSRTAAYSYDNDPSVRITRGLSKAAETNADLLAIADNAQHVADAVANNALGPMAAWASSDYTQFGSNAMMYTAQTIGAVTHPAKAVPGLAGDPPSTLTSSTLGAGPYGVAGNLANGIAAGAADQTTNASEPTQRLTTQGHDAMDVEFEISAVKPLYNPYVVTMTKLRTPMSKPGEIKTLVYAKSLDPIYTKATRVHFTEEGFPFEYEMVDFQLHIYDRGQEIATNLSSKRVELTRDEAFEYVKIEYVGAHRGETLPAVPAMGKLPAELPTRLAAGKYSEKFFARVSKDGLADEAYADEKCSKKIEDPFLEAVVKSIRFKPALDHGKPVDGIATLDLNKLQI
jgi:hypothetical protein